jgi:hypothetical protein
VALGIFIDLFDFATLFHDPKQVNAKHFLIRKRQLNMGAESLTVYPKMPLILVANIDVKRY